MQGRWTAAGGKREWKTAGEDYGWLRMGEGMDQRGRARDVWQEGEKKHPLN